MEMMSWRLWRGDEVDLVHLRFSPYFDLVVEWLEMEDWQCLENVVAKCWVKEEVKVVEECCVSKVGYGGLVIFGECGGEMLGERGGEGGRKFDLVVERLKMEDCRYLENVVAKCWVKEVVKVKKFKKSMVLDDRDSKNCLAKQRLTQKSSSGGEVGYGGLVIFGECGGEMLGERGGEGGRKVLCLQVSIIDIWCRLE
ncbi:hypothetical protein Tco_1274497 [Tanacetum coccineum]